MELYFTWSEDSVLICQYAFAFFNWLLEDVVLPYKHVTLSPCSVARLALLWDHGLLWLCFGCWCRGSGGSGRRRRRRGWTPSGLYSCAGHLHLSSFRKGSIVDTFQKEAFSLTSVESLVGSIDISADSGPTGLEHIWRAQRSGGHGCSTLKPAVLFQIREFETALWIHC